MASNWPIRSSIAASDVRSTIGNGKAFQHFIRVVSDPPLDEKPGRPAPARQRDRAAPTKGPSDPATGIDHSVCRPIHNRGNWHTF